MSAIVFITVARDLGLHRRRAGNPASCIRRGVGDWFSWSRREKLSEALITCTGLGLGYEARVFARVLR